MIDSVPDLERAEKACMQVRQGDLDRIRELCALVRETSDEGLLKRLLDRRGNALDPILALAASEALIAVGQVRRSVIPLEMLLEEGRPPGDLKKVALARAGQIALCHDVPIDVGPIVEELGLAHPDQAVRGRRRFAKRSEGWLVRTEALVLSALLDTRRAGMLGSQDMARRHIDRAYKSFGTALETVNVLEGGTGDYHKTRVMVEFGCWLQTMAAVDEGKEMLEAALDRCKARNYPLLEMASFYSLGLYSSQKDDGIGSLRVAKRTAETFGNSRFAGLCLMAEGELAASEAVDAKEMLTGARSMAQAADIFKGIGDLAQASASRSQAAAWSVRAGAAEEGLDLARKANSEAEKAGDRELITLALSAGVFALLKKDDRRGAKRALMRLLNEHPVKQYPVTFALLKEAVEKVPWLRSDKDTAFLFQREVVYTIERIAVDEIIARAKAAYPNEFGALLRGLYHITHIESVMEGAGGRATFMFSTYNRFSQRDLQGEGVVHSHPSGSVRPSKADLSMFGRFPGINIIIGYPFRDDSMAAYDRMGNRVRLEIGGPKGD